MKKLVQIKLMSRLAIALLILLPSMGMANSAGRDVTLKNLEIGENGQSITINVDGKVTTRTFVMSSPSRWVVDISPTKWGTDIQQVYVPQDTQYFGKIRIGQWRTHTSRLVIHTNGTNPQISVTDNQIQITFGDQISSSTNEPTKLETPIINKPESSGAANETGTSDSKTVDVPRVLPVSNQNNQIALTNPTQPTGNPADTLASGNAKTDKFEITCDGSTTKILINLTNEQTYDVQSLKYPDRLMVQYPVTTDTPNPGKVRFKLIDRERLPIGIIGYVSRFESTSASGVNKLLFEANKKFNYNTSINNGILNIDIRPVGSVATAGKTPDNTVANATDKTATETQPVKTTSETKPLASVVTLVGNDKTANDDKTTSDETQKFAPPEKPSFVVGKEKTDADHTIPESSTGIKLKEVTTGEEGQTASVKDMVGNIPNFANSSIMGGGKALEEGQSEQKGSDVPMMIEPPEEFKPLPKGSRPAADLYLTKGESVILPVKGLVRASVGDPETISINVLSPEELLITAKKEGRTTLILWEPDFGRSVRWINVGASSLLKELDLEKVINDPNIKVNFVGEKSVVLEGRVASEEQKKRAEVIAGGAADKVISLIEMYDPKRVLVKVRIVEIQNKDTEDFLKKLGTGTRTESGDFQFNVLSDILDPESPGGGIFDINLHPGIVHGNSGDERFDPIDLALNFLEQNRKGRILSQPNLVVLSGRQAHFRVGGEVPYTYQDEKGVNIVNFREFGIQLDVTPNVDSDNNILIHCEPSVRTVDNTLAIAGIPGFRTREVKTDIQVKDQQTIVIGGLLQHEIVTSKAKVPILGDIPIIGEAFKSKKHTDDETELLVFLTPMILKDITSVESDIKSNEDVSLSPYYQQEFVDGMKK
jgi:pilus assembly protein CpaC